MVNVLKVTTFLLLGFSENAKIVKYNMCSMGMNVGTFVDQLLPHSENIVMCPTLHACVYH